MPEHAFSDLDRQIIVRLTEDRLVYAPADGRGWQCRVADICWTSSRVSSRGIQEISLHGPDGRVVVTLLPFDGIERFYIALVRQLAARPLFADVEAHIPSQVALLERMVWMGDRTPAAERPWTFFRAANDAAVAATRAGLLLSSGPEQLERVAWSEIAGVRTRNGRTRVFRASDSIELPIGDLEAELTPSVSVIEYAPEGVRAGDTRLAMDYSWELDQARADRLLEPGEVVLAYARGEGDGPLVPGAPRAEPPALSPLGSVLARVVSDSDLTQSEVLLTDRRLLLLERDRETGELLSRQELEMDRLPRLKQVDGLLILGRFELAVDPTCPGMAADFVRRYRALVSDQFDPFGELPEAAPAAVLSAGPDPFASVLEKPLDLE